MFSPRWRKVLRDLWNNKVRTLLVVMSIAVGVFAVGVIVSTQIIMTQDLGASYAATDPASATIFVSPFDDEVVNTARHVEGVRAAEGRRSVSVRLKVGPEEWITLSLDAVSNYRDLSLNKIKPVEGAWPPPEHDVLIERGSLSLTRAKVGDKVLIELADGRQKELRIAGLVHDMNKPPAQFTGSPFGYVTFETLEWLGFERSFDQLQILADKPMDREYIDQVSQEVRKKVEKGGETVYFVWIPTPGKHPADDAIQPLLLILGVMGSLSLFLSGFLVVNTISALLTQQIRQIGVMKTIGAGTGQITGMYLGKVLLFGLLALFVAIPLGALGAYAFTSYLAFLINFDLSGFYIPLPALILEIAIGLIVPLVASLWPVFSGARISVREAISSYGLGKGHFGSNWIDRLLERVRGIPRPLLLSLRNTFRRKGRLLLTLFTLTLGGAIFISVLCVHASLLSTLDEFFNYWRYDVDISFTRPYRVDVVRDEALRVPGVLEAESWVGASANRVRPDGEKGRSLSIIGLPAETKLLTPKLLGGRWLLPDDQNALIINTSVTDEAMEPDLKVGDQVVFQIDGRDTTWQIVGLVQGVLTGPIMYANAPYLERQVSLVGRASSIQLVTEQHDTAAQKRIADAVKQHYENLGINVSNTQAIGTIREQIEYQFNIIVVFLAIMAVLLAVVGGLGLMGTMSINVIERTREIGVMRAIGATNGSVLQIFMTEGILIGFLSWAVGVLVAMPISQLLSQVVGEAFLQAPLSYVFSMPGALLWLAIVVVLASLASFLPSWNASRISVREVLAYE
jgi:putative ABC transport system permease protein